MSMTNLQVEGNTSKHNFFKTIRKQGVIKFSDLESKLYKKSLKPKPYVRPQPTEILEVLRGWQRYDPYTYGRVSNYLNGRSEAFEVAPVSEEQMLRLLKQVQRQHEQCEGGCQHLEGFYERLGLRRGQSLAVRK